MKEKPTSTEITTRIQGQDLENTPRIQAAENTTRIQAAEITTRMQNIEINRILQDFDKQYHRYAVSIGISEPTMWVLYTLCEIDRDCTQNELAAIWSTPKQTVNFAISGLIKKGLVELVPIPSAKNSKAVHLTEAGVAYCDKYIEPLLEVESKALLRMSEEERAQMIALLRKNKSYFVEEVEKIL